MRPVCHLLLLLVAAMCSVASGAPPQVATFDAVWVAVRDTHWDPTLAGVDWEAVRTQLRPKAEKANTPAELRPILFDMLGRLGQSHFSIIPGSDDDAGAPRARRREAHEGTAGATITLLPSPADPGTLEAVITLVEPGSSAAKAGLKPGMVLTAIDGKPILHDLPTGAGLERYERLAMARARTTGEPGTTATWTVSDGSSPAREVKLTFAADPRPKAKFGNLPPLPTSLEARTLDAAQLKAMGSTARSVGVIHFNIWLIPIARPFDQAVDSMRQCDGMVLDLRGNPGGIGGMAMGLAGHFTPESKELGTMYTREAPLNFVSNPRLVSQDGKVVGAYTGPLAILVDEGTASTSEIFAGGLQYLGRAKIFGTRTAGAALPALMDDLPNGDVLLHAIADYRLPDGRQLEASGVRPDSARAYTRADYAREGDPVLADAVRWIASERSRATPASSAMPGATAPHPSPAPPASPASQQEPHS